MNIQTKNLPFKTHWESTDSSISPEIINQIVKEGFPKKPLLSYEILQGGCANFNIKISLKNEMTPVILRIYLRDKEAACRERNLSDLFRNTIPVPESYIIGDVENYRYAFIQYIEGISLREFLLANDHADIKDLMKEVGKVLGVIQRYKFSRAGFFDQNLNVKKTVEVDDYKKFIEKCLDHQNVMKNIPKEFIDKIIFYIDAYSSLFPDQTAKNLVHGDYGPENILVSKNAGKWGIKAILDWEFAFSGSSLWDVSNMLRYAHHMPKPFKESFLLGLKEMSATLPENWQITIHLLTLSSLLDLLQRSHPVIEPIKCNDISRLIYYNLKKLDEYQ